MHLFSSLLIAILPAAPAERTLDAGTWVRQSLTVLPVAVEDCPSQDHFSGGSVGVDDVLGVVAGERMHDGSRTARSFCLEARNAVIATLGGDWSRLTGYSRFDNNPLPSALLQKLSQSFLMQGSNFTQELSSTIGDTLRAVVASKAQERSEHLRSSLQENSAVAIKMKTVDITDEELALLRGSAHVLALRVTGLDVDRMTNKDGRRFKARFHATVWSFDPVSKTFTQEAMFDKEESAREKTGFEAGNQVAENARMTDKLLDVKAFRFTTQVLSSKEGWWLRPASKFITNTSADLVVNRRFRYMENRGGGEGQSDKLVQAGYGYLDGRIVIDSSWRLRHIGGIRPYSGLILEEIPGSTWGIGAFTWAPSLIGTPQDTNGRTSDKRHVTITHASPMLEFRVGVRSNIGDLPNQHFLLDMPFYFANVNGALNEDLGREIRVTPTGRDTLRLRAQMPLSFLWGAGLEPGWCFRYPIRRLMFTGGVQAGLHINLVELGDEEVVDQRRVEQNWDKDDLPLTKSDVRQLMNLDGTVSVRGGVQFSLTPWSGLGFELIYDVLSGQGDFSYRKGSIDDNDWTDVPGPTLGQGRLRWMVQYVWK